MSVALLIVDHGSTREEANRMLESVAEILRRQRPDLIVEIAHMELAEPTLDQGLEGEHAHVVTALPEVLHKPSTHMSRWIGDGDSHSGVPDAFSYAIERAPVYPKCRPRRKYLLRLPLPCRK